MTTVILVASAVAVNVGAQLMLKRGILRLGEVSPSLPGLFDFILRVVQNAWIMTGLVLFGLGFLLWIVILSKMQLNIAYPTFTALNISFIILFSALFFREYLNIFQVIGIAVILLGVFLVYSK